AFAGFAPFFTSRSDGTGLGGCELVACRFLAILPLGTAFARFSTSRLASHLPPHAAGNAMRIPVTLFPESRSETGGDASGLGPLFHGGIESAVFGGFRRRGSIFLGGGKRLFGSDRIACDQFFSHFRRADPFVIIGGFRPRGFDGRGSRRLSGRNLCFHGRSDRVFLCWLFG